jgi:hypothetical protein
MTPVELAMIYWLRWNEMVESCAHYRYKAEGLGSLNPDRFCQLVKQIGFQGNPTSVREGLEHLGVTWNAGKRDRRVRWRWLPETEIKERIFNAAERYGYTEMELREHCPHCGMIETPFREELR